MTIDTILNNALLRLDEDEDEQPPQPPYVEEGCPFCAKQAHLGACAELSAFVERLRIRRLCPTCGAEMERAGKRAWVCPNQRTEEKVVSLELRLTIREMANERVTGVPF